jgi:hypothetical protein
MPRPHFTTRHPISLHLHTSPHSDESTLLHRIRQSRRHKQTSRFIPTRHACCHWTKTVVRLLLDYAPTPLILARQLLSTHPGRSIQSSPIHHTQHWPSTRRRANSPHHYLSSTTPLQSALESGVDIGAKDSTVRKVCELAHPVPRPFRDDERLYSHLVRANNRMQQ